MKLHQPATRTLSVKRNKMVQFDRKDLESAYARVQAGEYPGGEVT